MIKPGEARHLVQILAPAGAYQVCRDGIRPNHTDYDVHILYACTMVAASSSIENSAYHKGMVGAATRLRRFMEEAGWTLSVLEFKGFPAFLFTRPL